jgi:hypothetical protein
MRVESKATGKGKFVDDIKAFIGKFGTRYRLVVSFTFWQFYVREKDPLSY